MSDSIVICGPCLGDKDNVRMKRQNNGEECRFCLRPFPTLRWSGDTKVGKMRKTVICESCAKGRNCCQACSVDIDYLIPLDLRDAALKLAGLDNPYSVENSSKNKEVRAIMGDKLERRLKNSAHVDEEEKKERMRDILTKLAEKLGSQPPKPVLPKDKSSSASKEVAKVIANLPFGGSLDPPKSESDRSFFVFGFTPELPQYKISEMFEPHGDIESMKIVQRARCGYVTFLDRASAIKLVDTVNKNGLNSNKGTAGLAIIGNQPVRISWGNPQPLGKNNEDQMKISLVVAKVLKQLSERDAASKKRSPNQGKKQSNKRQKTATKLSSAEKGEAPKEKSTYKALSKDIEL